MWKHSFPRWSKDNDQRIWVSEESHRRTILNKRKLLATFFWQINNRKSRIYVTSFTRNYNILNNHLHNHNNNHHITPNRTDFLLLYKWFHDSFTVFDFLSDLRLVHIDLLYKMGIRLYVVCFRLFLFGVFKTDFVIL